MDFVAILLLTGVLVLDTVSHLALKGASAAVAHASGIAYWRAVLTRPGFWIGIAAFVGLFVCWLGFLSIVPLAQGVMLGSITIVGVMLGGRIMYGERITRPRALGICLIAIGVTLVGWGGSA